MVPLWYNNKGTFSETMELLPSALFILFIVFLEQTTYYPVNSTEIHDEKYYWLIFSIKFDWLAYNVLHIIKQVLFWAELGQSIIIKVESHPWYRTNIWLIWMGMKEKTLNVIFSNLPFPNIFSPKFQELVLGLKG